MTGEKSVQGIRHKPRTAGEVAFGVVGWVLMLSPIVWLVEFIRLEGYESNAGMIGSLWWPVLAVVLFFVGILGVDGMEKKDLLESDCPCCGAHATRRYWGPSSSTPCGTCPAYLRADGDRVREESLDARARYSVGEKRYQPAAKRNDQGRLSFKMPAMCAVCGKPHEHTRDVYVGSRLSSSGPSIVGMLIVETSSGSTRRKMDLNYDGTVKQRGPRSPTDEDRRREELADVKVPVCSEHANERPVECMDGTFEFASYRYYKEFLALNTIDAPEPKS